MPTMKGGMIRKKSGPAAVWRKMGMKNPFREGKINELNSKNPGGENENRRIL
jgi:hypothetical protein